MEISDKLEYSEGTKLTWPLKLLFFIGGWIGMTTILIPLGVLLKNEATTFFFGICFLATSIAMTRLVDNEKLILSVAYPLCLTGQISFNIGLIEGFPGLNMAFFANLLLLVVMWIFCRNHFMRQVFVLAFFIIFPLIFMPDVFWNDEITLQFIFLYYAISLFALYGLTICYDADKCNREDIFAQLYAQYIPTIRFCTIATSIGYALTANIINNFTNYYDDIHGHQILCSIGDLIPSLICATFSFIVAYNLLSRQMKGSKNFYWFIGLAFIGCAASCITTSMSIAVLGLILAYTVLDYLGVAISGCFLIYSLSLFYYDLEMTLLHKSYLLMGSGIVFLSLFFLLKKLAK